MISISIKDDFKALDRRLALMLDPAQQVVATRQALNKVVEKARTTVRAEIYRHYNLPKKEINPRVSMSRARGRSLEGLVAWVEPLPSASTPGRSMNVVRFVVRKVSRAERARRQGQGIASTVVQKTKRGKTRTHRVLFFQIRRDGVPQRIRGAFIGNAGRTVFRRTGRGRLPIESVQTLDVTRMFAAKRVVEPVLKRIRDELPIEIERAIRLQLDGKR